MSECGAETSETDEHGTYYWGCTLPSGHAGRHEAWGGSSYGDTGPYYVWEDAK